MFSMSLPDKELLDFMSDNWAGRGMLKLYDLRFCHFCGLLFLVKDTIMHTHGVCQENILST